MYTEQYKPAENTKPRTPVNEALMPLGVILSNAHTNGQPISAASLRALIKEHVPEVNPTPGDNHLSHTITADKADSKKSIFQ